MFKCWWPKTTNERRKTKDERRTNELIGPNFERMTNDEFNVATDVNASDVGKFVKVLNARKKSAWTDLDRVDFEKFFSKSQCSNRKIGVDWSRQSQKRPLQRQVSLNFFTTGHPGVAEAFCTSMACP
jgi:hypothetical protein